MRVQKIDVIMATQLFEYSNNSQERRHFFRSPFMLKCEFYLSQWNIFSFDVQFKELGIVLDLLR